MRVADGGTVVRVLSQHQSYVADCILFAVHADVTQGEQAVGTQLKGDGKLLDVTLQLLLSLLQPSDVIVLLGLVVDVAEQCLDSSTDIG